MCDRDTACSSPGLRAQLGRFFSGLLPYRLLQLLGAGWAYLMGLGGRGPALFSFLIPTGWIVHKQVGPGEVLEALREFAPVPWEDLEECLEEMGPWNELNPGKEQSPWEPGIEILKSLKGFVCPSKEQDLWDTELHCWEENMAPSKEQGLWDPDLDSWKELLVTNQNGGQCHWKSSVFSSNGHNKCDHTSLPMKPIEEISQVQFPGFNMVSCILSPGTGGVLTWMTQGNEQNLQDKVDLGEISKIEPDVELQHIRNKRLWFLQQNQAHEVLNLDKEQNQNNDLLYSDQQQMAKQPPEPSSMDLKTCEWQQCEQQLTSDKNQGSLSHDWEQIILDSNQMLNFDSLQNNSLEVAVTNQEQKHDIPIFISEKKQAFSENKYLPSPDQDQGYFSLEDWQSFSLSLDLQTNIANASNMPCELSELQPVPERQVHTEPGKEDAILIDDKDSGGADSDLEEDILVRPVCNNKHISYILGTPCSDEEDASSSSDDDDDDWDDDDDGFDSEGSVLDSEEPQDSQGVELLNYFNIVDPYNPQNFTATIHTGVRVESPQTVETHEEAQEEEDDSSWCDSLSGSSSEDECSADEEENLKLWNSFMKSEDPYNPLCFKASVQTAEQKRQSRDASSKYTEQGSGCGALSYTEVSLSCQSEDPQSAHIISKLLLPVRTLKKVTFSDKVTEYYVCSDEIRKGPWEEYARDRCRFQRRIQETKDAIGHCFASEYRQRVWDRMQESWNS
ncbi:protein phosphatase 1 regulatory subunit 15B [Bombina bombina]|uniref:protein phosphatase 1 regulatory subunit 15B n=1 Tax=Bombina bombina TaxID=8345 RepID=UPI00235AA803|nr:protein phosphatase 1 regulatory subunit 15B [Bombina bombina]